MKHLWLEYNKFLDVYVYYEGIEEGRQHNRHEFRGLDTTVLLDKIKDLVNKDRRSVFHLRGISEDLFIGIKYVFENTKVGIDYQE